MPPLLPAQFQFHGPVPVTDEAVPVVHKLVVGLLLRLSPFDEQHAPLMIVVPLDDPLPEDEPLLEVDPELDPDELPVLDPLLELALTPLELLLEPPDDCQTLT